MARLVSKLTVRDEVVALAHRARRGPSDMLETWAERAAIYEYDGGQLRHRAERAALEDLQRCYESQRRLM